MSTINKTWKEIYDLTFELDINQELKKFIDLEEEHPPTIEDIYAAIDYIWNNIGCDNLHLNHGKLNQFYAHPIWLLNGLFIEQHELSMQHRDTISDWIVDKKFKNVLDFGGGFGTLARLISKKDSSSLVDIYEPYPNEYALLKVKNYSNICFIDHIDKKYDCLVSTDVLEHVPDPLKLFSEMIESVKMDGYLIIANNFYPVIKCHLPSTFHLRYTFKIFTQMMGLHSIGSCDGASHAIIYQKKKNVVFDWQKIRKYERISQRIYPFLNAAHHFYSKTKGIIK